MAAISSPAMAAAVSNAGALGSLSVGTMDATRARATIREVGERTSAPININLFCHRAPAADSAVEAAWIERLRPAFEAVGANPQRKLAEIYRSFSTDKEMYHLLLAERPAVVSFHFGLPPQEWIDGLRGAGIVLLATATDLDEGRAIAGAGLDAVIAQGWEAGGHRGVFDPDAEDSGLGSFALTRLLVRELDIPVIAAGGIMDGAGVGAVLGLGASAAQLGTAFIACDESEAEPAHRAALAGEAARRTVLTRAISGRPARCLANRFTALTAGVPARQIPPYPLAYDLGKALHADHKAVGEFGYGAHWAGQGAPLARSMSSALLVETLAAELEASRSGIPRDGTRPYE